MTLRPLLLALPLLLAACASQTPAASPLGTPERGCEDQTDADPRLKNFVLTNNGNTAVIDYNAKFLNYRQKLIMECLRIRSGKPSGGVEKPTQ